MDQKKHIGMEVHQASITVVVRDATGKVVAESIIETKAISAHVMAGLSRTARFPSPVSPVSSGISPAYSS
jgi:hypothetical protein